MLPTLNIWTFKCLQLSRFLTLYTSTRCGFDFLFDSFDLLPLECSFLFGLVHVFCSVLLYHVGKATGFASVSLDLSFG